MPSQRLENNFYDFIKPSLVLLYFLGHFRSGFLQKEKYTACQGKKLQRSLGLSVSNHLESHFRLLGELNCQGSLCLGPSGGHGGIT